MNQHAADIETQDRHSRFRRKRAYYAVVSGAMLCVMSAATFASGAWNEASIPVGEVVAQDAFVSGVVRLHGSDFTLYSGARIQSLSKGLDVNLEHGGTVALCPRSELQVLSSHGHPGVMLAFQTGGSESPFMMRSNDVVMTPDWRIELKESEDGGAPASLLLTMNEKGDVCFQGHAPQSSYFHVSHTADDAAFDLYGISLARFADGDMQPNTTPCSCLVGSQPASSMVASAPQTPSDRPITSSPSIGGLEHADAAPLAASPTEGPSHSEPIDGYRQRPQDVVGYLGAAIHFLFGR
jgi:hypothetical protein